MNIGVDVARQMTPPRYQPASGCVRVSRTTPPRRSFLSSTRRCTTHSRAGLSVVVDVGHHDADVLADCARRLAGLPVLFVGVRCPIDVIMERRSAAEGGYVTGSSADPVPAPARAWQHEVHVPGTYDLEVDTSVLSPQECAEAIRRRLTYGPPGVTFGQIAEGTPLRGRRPG